MFKFWKYLNYLFTFEQQPVKDNNLKSLWQKMPVRFWKYILVLELYLDKKICFLFFPKKQEADFWKANFLDWLLLNSNIFRMYLKYFNLFLSYWRVCPYRGPTWTYAVGILKNYILVFEILWYKIMTDIQTDRRNLNIILVERTWWK